MFKRNKFFDSYTDEEKAEAEERYLNALTLSVQGTAIVILKREVKHIFVNAYNKLIMALFKSNHDCQICIDPYAATQYITKYVTKSESGMSLLLKAINDSVTSLNQMDRLNALSSALDKNREVSIQECIYRLLGLPMTKSSVKVKYVSTVHPKFRDGLLRGNIQDLSENDSIFHLSIHQYYELRPYESLNQEKINYVEEELMPNYWNQMSLAEVCSKYEIAYGQKPANERKKKTYLIPLLNNQGYIR